MSPAAEKMREHLEVRELAAFLQAYEQYRDAKTWEPALTALTQRVFPPLLREALKQDSLSASAIVRLYHLIRGGRLLLVENDLLTEINRRIDTAFAEAEPATSRPVPPLLTFDEVAEKSTRRTVSPPPLRATEVKRVAIVSAFSIETWSNVDAFDFRRNVCASQQEREFLRAVRQFFPSLRAYPNVPLRNFIDLGKLEALVPIRTHRYGWSAQVDILLCTDDEDPVAGIELDSVFHDSEEAIERDQLKNTLFKLAGLPMIRIRADDEKAVRAEDFYDLLVAEAEALEALRPRRMRPRRTHDFLVPAESYHRAANV
jgi:hypothetical protein